MLLTTYTVNSNADTNTGTATTGTLRYVLTQLDSSGGSSNTITFDLPSKQQTIAPGSPLPTITNQVDIEGSTQPGFSGAPLIAITGDLLGIDVNGVDGLTLGNGSSGSTIEGLVIEGFGTGYGIELGSSNNSVIGCYIGTDVAGETAEANSFGVSVINGSGNTIGGTSTGDANVISGNGDGIYLNASCLVEGNLIGTDVTGASALPNSNDGIDVRAPGATIGGTSAGAGNVISGNSAVGVYLNASCLVEGNLIGTNKAGTGAVLNSNFGIYVDLGATDATIGGTSVGAANVISGNGNSNGGFGIYAGASCLIEGNLIGTNATGTSAVPNTLYGIYIGWSGVTIGGTSAGSTNVISGNGSDGIGTDESCLIEGNLIGTNKSGTSAVPNSGDGIHVENSGATIGGASAGSTNVISGNGADGIYLDAPCLVEGNLIGTNKAGTNAVPNSGDGIHVEYTGATIGGTSAGAANVISGNGNAGIYAVASCLVAGNLVGTNMAGTSAVPNSLFGIYVDPAAAGVTIGGTSAAATNVISGNGGDGIDAETSCLIEGNLIGTDVTGASAVPNSGDGISVGAAGTTIGGTAAGTANVISGNGNSGIILDASCLVEGNLLGTDKAGTSGVPNSGDGISVGATGATIGGTTAGAANVVSGNGTAGIYLDASCLVEGNLIGVNAAGTSAVPNLDSGIFVGAAGATIGGTSACTANVISGNRYEGIVIDASCLVEGNLIGTNVAGTIAVPDSDNGIFVGAVGATIGGTTAGTANVISGNGNSGIILEASCLIEGNLLGTDKAGTSGVPNSGDGISVDATGATIGGTTAGAANVVSGNGSAGIYLDASCLVEGNLIGVNAAGTSAVPNLDSGIFVGAGGATIGGTSACTANVISGNRYEGIVIDASCLVEGNLIGTNVAGTIAVPDSDNGIFVGAVSATIGGTTAGTANVISGNGNSGIILEASCLVEGNLLGTDKAGTSGVPNSGDGISVDATGATIGGTTAGTANVISGNGGDGIDAETPCLVEGNLIGTDVTGASAAPNSVYGIDVEASGATIGGTSVGAANVISGNGADGIDVGASCLVEGNRIGTDTTGANAVPNQGIGVYVVDGLGVTSTIGGANAGAGNVIAFNGGPGVATAPGTTGSFIEFNAIFGNGGPGIDLNDDGVTPNTPNGANNTPVLDSSDFGIITGTLDATPNSTYIIDFYASSMSDAAPARPQGRDYLGSVIVTTGLTGEASLVIQYTPIPGEPIITATSTDASGTTSEFSAPFGYLLTASGMTFAAIAGTPFEGSVASFTTSDSSATGADFSATINYGTGDLMGTVVPAPDGFLVVGSYNFPSADPALPVTVTIIDKRGFGRATANSLADVAGSGLTPFAQSVEFVAGTAYSRVVAGFTDAMPLAFPRQFTASIAWGDNTTSSAGTVSTDGAGFDVTGLHTYNVAGTYPITVTINDAVTGAVLVADSTAVVDPVPITIQTKNFAVTGGVSFSGTVATFTDGDVAHQLRVLHRHHQLGRQHGRDHRHGHRHEPIYGDRVAHLRDIPEHRHRDDHDHRQERAYGDRLRPSG